jgi:hypothetical protein
MKRFIVITSIFNPTESVKKFSKLENCTLVVVGDKKTPADWGYSNVIYLSPEDQLGQSFGITDKLPWNHYCRKMVGYLYAMKEGADEIVDTDDDNSPYDAWNFPSFSGNFDESPAGLGYVNIYKSFSKQEIWPRGFPLDLILDKRACLSESQLSKEKTEVGVWQGLADGDPDVDAIYRLTSNQECRFDSREPIVLGKGTLSPFNSQNTAFRKETFPLLFLPSFVTFRFTDILRGYVAQPILWSMGLKLGFTKATVFQDRNPHDFVKDMESEIPAYTQSRRAVEVVLDKVSPSKTASENLKAAYKGLKNEQIVTPREVELVNLWLKDLKRIGIA